MLEEVAKADATMLAIDKSGVGKESISNEVRKLGQGVQRRLAPMNCAAIPENLFEPEGSEVKKGIHQRLPTLRRLVRWGQRRNAVCR